MQVPIVIKQTAFTIRYSGIARELITDVSLKVNDIFPDLDHSPKKFKAIWDTGATNSVITLNAVNELKLPVTGRATTCGVHGTQEVNTYIVDIILLNNVIFNSVEVTEGYIGDPDRKIDFLVGMDIIRSGDFSVTNVKGKTIFSFRVPSFKEIDYVPETNAFNLKLTPGFGRNQRKRWQKEMKKKK